MRNSPLAVIGETELIREVKQQVPLLRHDHIETVVKLALRLCAERGILVLRAEPSDYNAIVRVGKVKWYV